MAAKLTAEQREDLQLHGNRPVPVIDPDTNATYFLVTDEFFERLRPFFDDDPLDVRETYAAQSNVAGTAGWNDPAMDVYNDYDGNKPQP